MDNIKCQNLIILFFKIKMEHKTLFNENRYNKI